MVPSYKRLVLESGVALPNYNGTFDIYSRTIPGSGIAKFATRFRTKSGANSQTRHDVLVDGNVGIGNMAPSYKLDVNGTIRSSNVSPSDARWKTNIHTIEDPLEKVAQLRGVTYEWADPSKGTGEQIGVIAQEVEQVFPQAVSTDNEGYKSVAYARLAAPMIEAIKELKNENGLLKQEISALKSAVQTLIKERETR